MACAHVGVRPPLARQKTIIRIIISCATRLARCLAPHLLCPRGFHASFDYKNVHILYTTRLYIITYATQSETWPENVC